MSAVDPYGNHPRQLFEIGFALGCTFDFSADIDQLAESNIPADILERYRAQGDIFFSLDAAFHEHYEPRFDDEGVTLQLSFDKLYDCYFPWSSIARITFHLGPTPPEAEDDDDTEDFAPKGPHLRLVT